MASQKLLSDPQSLQDGSHRRHYAEFTQAGRAKLKADETYHQDCDLFLGIDYSAKSGPDPWWFPFPDVQSTQHFRHTCMIDDVNVPLFLFIGCPVPMKRDESTERSALLTMS